MPIYVYKCTVCKKEKDVRHPMKEDPDIVCCDAKMKRVPQAIPFQFRGAGFYGGKA